MASTATSDGSDVKPAAQVVTLKVKDPSGQETIFKVKRTTKMKKVFEAYASRKGVRAESMRFLVDGERVQETDTPESLELEDQDQIDAMVRQEGGRQ